MTMQASRQVYIQNNTPGAKPPGNSADDHCTGGWVGPGAAMEGHEKYCAKPDSILGTYSPWQSLYGLRLSQRLNAFGKSLCTYKRCWK
jgi:hypothetical protein